MTTKCPKCEKDLAGVAVKRLKGLTEGEESNYVSLNCSRCGTSLGIQLDPMAIKAELMAEIRSDLRANR